MAESVLPIPDITQPAGHSPTSKPKLYVLDYGAGNVRSLANSINALGYEFEWIKDESDFDKAEKLIFPGVGSFEKATSALHTSSNLSKHLLNYIASGKPYFGICIGMQVLFETSTESPGSKGLGVVPFGITEFTSEDASVEGGKKSVPHMGWNRAWKAHKEEGETELMLDEDYYFVHSYAALLPKLAPAEQPPKSVHDFAYTLSRYGSETFISSIRRDNVFACQFHPEKSGPAGLDLLKRWLDAPVESLSSKSSSSSSSQKVWQPINPDPLRAKGNGLTNRIVACLDVRSNDAGDLVVTKGDQYDVREKSDQGGEVRNLGKPVELAQRYYLNGADEVAFLNITSFRQSALLDQPMLEVVKAAAETCFVPLTIGGGIKDTVDPDGTVHSALEVAGTYFRSGADKVSIGSEAVIAVEQMLEREARGEPAFTGKTGIESISKGYGRQAVVVSIDPKRVYVDTSSPDWLSSFPEKHLPSLVIGDKATSRTAPQEKGKAWWYQCTISGGRAVRDIDVVQLAKGVERLGAGEILLNSVDRDGSGAGFDLDLIKLVKGAVGIPVVSSSGAGGPGDFEEVFRETGTEAALAAGIFHREEVGIDEVKSFLEGKGMAVRNLKP